MPNPIPSKRKINRRALEQDTCELQMTPMIDVTFLLLIFFMCTLKFKTLEGAIGANLPKDVGASAEPAEPLEKAEIRIAVVEEGTRIPVVGERFKFGPDRVVRYQVGPRAGMTKAEAFAAIKGLHGASPDVQFTIDAEDGVIQDEVVQVMDHLIAVGVEGVTFKARPDR